MFRLVGMCCAIAAFTLDTPLSAAASVGDTTTYDTVDAIGVFGTKIRVTGIISGQSSPSTTLYTILGSRVTTTDPEPTDVAASRCDRLALLAMSKPGKFQFAVVVEQLGSTNQFSCKLIVRTP